MMPPRPILRFFAISLLALFAICHLPSAIAAIPTQGAAAADLIRKSIAPSVPSIPSPPSLVLPTNTPDIFHFAATATDASGMTSDYSTEAVFTNTAGATMVTLAWDASSGTNQIVCYQIYTGGTTRTYTNMVSAGTNLILTLPLYPPPLTNLVLTVTATTGATNLLSAPRPSGPWTLLGTTNYVATNPPSPRYYRAVGAPGTRVSLATRRQ